MSGARLRHGALALLSFGLAIGAAEWWLARWHPQRTLSRLMSEYPPIYAADSVLPNRLVPHTTGRLTRPQFDTRVRINSLGYRGADIAREKGRVFRILAIGDSFTFGWGVEDDEAYPSALERELRARCGTDDLQVVNAGFAAGHYPDTYYLFLKHAGRELKADLVLLGLFVGNDLDHYRVDENEWTAVDDSGLPLRIVTPGRKIVDGRLAPDPLPRRYRVPLLANSHLVQGLAAVLRPPRVTAEEWVNPWIYRPVFAARTELAWARVERLLVATAETARRDGARFVIAIIPGQMQVYPELYPVERFPMLEGADLDKPQRKLSEFFAAHDMAFVDLLPDLRAHRGTPGVLYMPDDPHWTAAGHRRAAESLAAFLAGGGHLRPACGPERRS